MRYNIVLVWLSLAHLSTVSYAASWHTIHTAGFHESREETTLAACGGNDICLLGGRNMRQTPVLNTKTLQWYKGPQPPQEIHHFQGVTGPDGCAWILGAWTGRFPDETTVPEIYRYCAESKEWSVFGEMSRPRGGGGAVYYGGYFYVVTGNVGGHKVAANVVPWFDRFDPKTKKWTQLPDVPHPRDHVNVAVVDNKLYVVGGRNSGASFPEFFALTESKVDVFDFSTNSWSTLESDFPSPRAGSPVVVLNNEIWIAGGEGSGKAWVEVDVLSKSNFKIGPPMIHPRHGFGMCSCNGVIYVAGGAGVQGGGNSQTMLDAYYNGDKPAPCTVSVTWYPSNVNQTTPTGTSSFSPKPSKDAIGILEKPSPEVPKPSTAPLQETPKASEAPKLNDAIPIQRPVQISPKPSSTYSESNSTSAQNSVSSKPSTSPRSSTISPSRSVSLTDTSRDPLNPLKNTTSSESEIKRGSDSENNEPKQMKPTELPELDENNAVASSDSMENENLIEPEPSSGEVMTGEDTQSDQTFNYTEETEFDILDDSKENDQTLDIPKETGSDLQQTNTDAEIIPGFPEASQATNADDMESSMEGSACFPGHATVLIKDGSIKSMEQLEIGDNVLVSHPDTYSEVYFFSHKHSDQLSSFITLRTGSGHSLQLSARHLVYANDKLIEAEHVRVGDKLRIAQENNVQFVSAVSRSVSKGLFNPHTIHGDIIVNDVAASTLTRTLHPQVARALLKPFAAIYKVLGPHTVVHSMNRYLLRTFERVFWQ